MTAGELQSNIHDIKKAFQLATKQPAVQMMLKDLAEFCRAYESCFNVNERVHSRFEGRRDVWLHIRQYLDLSEEDLYKVATGGMLPPTDMEDDDERN